jgi:hypothetical protein
MGRIRVLASRRTVPQPSAAICATSDRPLASWPDVFVCFRLPLVSALPLAAHDQQS